MNEMFSKNFFDIFKVESFKVDFLIFYFDTFSIVSFLYFTVGFLYFAVGFFVLLSLSLFCRGFSVYRRGFLDFAVFFFLF